MALAVIIAIRDDEPTAEIEDRAVAGIGKETFLPGRAQTAVSATLGHFSSAPMHSSTTDVIGSSHSRHAMWFRPSMCDASLQHPAAS